MVGSRFFVSYTWYTWSSPIVRSAPVFLCWSVGIRASDQISEGNPNWNSHSPDPATSKAPWRLFNIGNNNPIKLLVYIEAIEQALGKRSIKKFLPLQPGDVPDTFADSNELKRAVGYEPVTAVSEGVANFVAWYRNYYQVWHAVISGKIHCGSPIP